MPVEPRNVSLVLNWIRNKLLKREFKNSLRFADYISPRSQPPPRLPDGPSHKLFGNYYFTRDARHQVQQPIVCKDASKTQLLSAKSEVPELSHPSKKTGGITPGTPYVWDK